MSQISLQLKAGLGSLRVSGIFRTCDNASFARAMATLHGLAVLERPKGLALK